MSLTSQTDTELVALVAAGQMGGFGELYRRHAVATQRQARRMVGGHADADDLVADTFLAVLTSIQRDHRPENFPAYLYGTLRHRHADRIRKQQRCPVVGLLDDHDHPSTRLDPTGSDLDPADLLDARLDPNEIDTIRRAFRTQPPRSRLALWLHCVEEHTPTEIARRLGTDPTAMRMLLWRARRAMRRTHNALEAAELRTRSTGSAAPALASSPSPDTRPTRLTTAWRSNRTR